MRLIRMGSKVVSLLNLASAKGRGKQARD
jgi:hypothetical protein